MSQTYLEARPTEYRGIVFKSKCEAIFARALDAASRGQWLWQYEPEHRAIQGYTPDFEVIQCLSKKPEIIFSLIELKPGPVTETYRKNLEKRFTELESRFTDYNCWLVIGNPFDSRIERTVEHYSLQFGWIPLIIEDTWFFSGWDEALKWRFDLEHQRL